MDLLAVLLWLAVGLAAFVLFAFVVIKLAGPVFIGTDQVGIVERKWGGKDRREGAIIAQKGENGVLSDMLMTGLHFRPGLFFKVKKYAFVTVGTGSIAYIFARDGKPLAADQALAATMPLDAYLNVTAFFDGGGQKGPQRTILREGTYIVNLAQFAIITEKAAYFHPMGDDDQIYEMQQRIDDNDGFRPVIIDRSDDKCGIVVVNDGPALPSGTIIAPLVGDDKNDPETYHNNFQDIEKFLKAGGFRGRQYQVITEGTWFINRLFATVELIDKVVVPVGYTGVVVSYYGDKGEDVSGEDYRHGELVENGKRGIWQDGLLPGKYAFNSYAGKMTIVPTTNIILKWIKNETGGEHGYDTRLAEIEMITRDAFEPLLPLQVVIHIDYQKAPKVIQRFGDIEVLVNQSLDPMVSAFFKNIGQTRTLIELLQQRGAISQEALTVMRSDFESYDLALENVLIGTPRPKDGDNRIEQILNQLRDRQVAVEQKETFALQTEAAEKQRELNEANAAADKQTDLTNSAIEIQVQENAGKAEATRAKQEADKITTIATADAAKVRLAAEADADKVKLSADAEAEKITKTGQAEADRVSAMAEANAKQARDVGIAEAEAIEKRIEAFSGEGAALQVRQALGIALAEAVKDGKMRLTPDQVVVLGGSNGASVPNTVETLMALILSDKIGAPVVLEKTPTEPAEPGKVIEMPVAEEEPSPPEVAEQPVAVGAEAESIPATAEVSPDSEQQERKPRRRGGHAKE